MQPNLEQALTAHTARVRANFKLIPPSRREAAAVRELRQRLEAFLPLLRFVAEAGRRNPKLIGGALQLPQTNIEIPIAAAMEFIEFLDVLDRDVLLKT